MIKHYFKKQSKAKERTDHYRAIDHLHGMEATLGIEQEFYISRFNFLRKPIRLYRLPAHHTYIYKLTPVQNGHPYIQEYLRQFREASNLGHNSNKELMLLLDPNAGSFGKTTTIRVRDIGKSEAHNMNMKGEAASPNINASNIKNSIMNKSRKLSSIKKDKDIIEKKKEKEREEREEKERER